MTDVAIQVVTVADGVARVSWDSRLTVADWRLAVDAVRRDVEKALAEHARVEAHVAALTTRTPCAWPPGPGMRREGVMRGVDSTRDLVVFARLRTDHSGARAGRIPGAAQLVPAAQAGDQPDAGARPRRPGAALPASPTSRTGTCPVAWSRSVSRLSSPSRERCPRSSALDIPARPAAADRLAAAVGWLGRRALSGLRRRGPRRRDHRQDRARRPARSGTPSLHASTQARGRCADFTARRVEAALAATSDDAGPAYTESGR